MFDNFPMDQSTFVFESKQQGEASMMPCQTLLKKFENCPLFWLAPNLKHVKI